MKKIGIIIPTYNEKKNIRMLVTNIVKFLQNSNFDPTVLIIDDNSPDKTSEEIKKMNGFNSRIFLIVRETKLGLGSAYIVGYEWMLKHSINFVIQMDADNSHPPNITPELAKLIYDNNDVVIASRYVDNGGIKSWPLKRVIISKIANYLVRFFLVTGIKDNTSGYRAFNKTAMTMLLNTSITSKGFSYLPESAFFFKKNNFRIVEFPFIFEDREVGETKLSYIEILGFLKSIIRLCFGNIKGSYSKL